MSGPGLHQGFHQRQTQQLVLAPQMRQSLKILQVAALDLRAAIQEELQANPTLEEMPMDDVSLEKSATSGDEKDVPNDDPREEMDFSKDLQLLERIGQDWKDHMSDTGGVRQTTGEEDERRQHFFDSLTTETSLQQHLMSQAELADCPAPTLEALHFLVGSLDDRGYLTSTLSDLALLSHLPLEAMQAAAKLLKTFDPAGIGAESLADCLLIQLTLKGREKSVAARIIRDHFDLLVRRRIPDLARKTGLAPEIIQEAIEEIGTLDPAPGRRFADDANRVVVADVSVE
ncbi:MAG: RNA polymerase sigma-54 factor, partial [bacterium]|nr:RNA polymerase sigma-54 factor [bacterium]